MNILKTADAAKILNVSKQTIEAWRLRGGGPAYLKMGKAVRYRRQDLEEFVEKSVRNNPSDTE